MQNTLLVLIMLLFNFQESKPETFEPVTVLELFTSQGCSSCPKADALLGIVKNDNSTIIALSYHVDYWNYIGWKDPFSNKYNTDRQRSYGEKFFSNRIYTPQLVVNGKEHFVGSNAATLNNKLETYGKQVSVNEIVLTNLKRNGNTLNLDYNIKGNTENKNIRFALVINERTTEIKRGENRNRTIKNENIVVNEIISKVINSTGNATVEIPEVVNSKDELSIVAIIQTSNLDITGAVEKGL
ncbi:thioredoxin family protein [Lacinutrix sp.]|uniref:DUF1223 domain-containing protein n=1 Tax=Lacinutrix sp. TaxID=1937692 RepID=UPI0025BB810B|nr:DUF1223 domain-containing protein [Lacinutrix sp.]